MIQLTRKEMSQLLLALKGQIHQTPLSILQESWAKTHHQDMSISLPPILEKIIKLDTEKQKEFGFSLNDIVSLGNQIEYTHFSLGAVQNWVKRDMKEWIGTPQLGKKYTIEQAAMIFIIEDLKTTLDFDSIRKLFTCIFNLPEDISDDLINPIDLFAAYSSIFEELDKNNDQILDIQPEGKWLSKKDKTTEKLLYDRSKEFVHRLDGLNPAQKEAMSNMLLIAIVSVQTSYFQSLAKRYFNATLFLQNESFHR